MEKKRYLKKAVETKNFLENELVRFKRTHSEDQNMLQELKLKLVQAENQNHSLSYDVTELHKQKNIADSDVDTLKRMLESTRQQLSQKIEENEKLELRLKMLERLNTNLSVGV
jgi:superfamily I DNA and/or RNA helicase